MVDPDPSGIGRAYPSWSTVFRFLWFFKWADQLKSDKLLGLVETGWAADGLGLWGELSSLSQPTRVGHGSGVSLRNSWGEHEGPSWTPATQSILLACQERNQML